MGHTLPPHLKKYIVEQHYEKYTPVDQACWRFVLRQLKAFLGKHAHESYLEGLEKTGIEIEQIPRIEDISQKIEKFGWRALPVSGFIPPAAFMELQALGVLPIASDIRSIEHLSYTPAPDIIHEAAGHAPILVQPEFAAYLREYAQVARKALISKEDLELYEAIRHLSDIKESPTSSSVDIAAAQTRLEASTKNTSHVSEAAELGRMNWWTAEYGLIGSLEKPRIFGAGLLSSVGESRLCLSEAVKKIPLTVDCVRQPYDITEPQPQLFVTPDFQTLQRVLTELAERMAFKKGGLESVRKAIQARTVNTVQLNSGIQISGLCTEVLPGYLRFQGPTQLCFQDHQLSGHDKKYHALGFGTTFGFLKNSQKRCLSLFSENEVASLKNLEFQSGVVVEGKLKSSVFKNGHLILLSFENCTVTRGDQILFDPSWGTYDMAVGSEITSVFGGPADRESYGSTDDFIAARVPPMTYSKSEQKLHKNYQKLRDLREQKSEKTRLEEELSQLMKSHLEEFPHDWLLLLEAIELAQNRLTQPDLALHLEKWMMIYIENHPDKKSLIEDGLSLANQL